MIRLVVVDDHALVRTGLSLLIARNEDMAVVGTAQDGAEGVDVVSRLLPDVVLMDLSMPRMDGVDATRRITASCPAVRVLVLTADLDTEHILPAIAAGAAGYLSKEVDGEALMDAIAAVAAGKDVPGRAMVRTGRRANAAPD